MGLRSSVRARMAPSSALGPNWTRLVLQLSNGSTRATMQPSCFEPISRPRAFDLRESARSDAGFSSHESPLEDRRSNRPDANCGEVPPRRSSARPLSLPSSEKLWDAPRRGWRAEADVRQTGGELRRRCPPSRDEFAYSPLSSPVVRTYRPKRGELREARTGTPEIGTDDFIRSRSGSREISRRSRMIQARASSSAAGYATRIPALADSVSNVDRAEKFI
jgi:hypothetical protein